MIRRPPRSTQSRSSAASDVYKRQVLYVYTHVGRWYRYRCRYWPRYRYIGAHLLTRHVRVRVRVRLAPRPCFCFSSILRDYVYGRGALRYMRPFSRAAFIERRNATLDIIADPYLATVVPPATCNLQPATCNLQPTAPHLSSSRPLLEMRSSPAIILCAVYLLRDG